MIWGALAMIVYVLCWPILAWLAGKLIPAIGSGDFQLVITVISQALIVFLIQKFAQFFQDTLLAKPSLILSQQLRQDLFKKLQKIEIQSIEKLSSGDIAYRLTEDADRVGEVIYKTIQDTAPCLLQLIAVFGYMLILDYKLSLATLLLAPLISILVGKFGEKVLFTAEKSQEQVSNLAGLLSEGIQSLPLIRAFGVEDWFQSRFDQQVELHRKARFKTLKLLALQHPVIGFIEAFGILFVLAFGALRIQSGDIDGQGFSSFFAALIMLIDPISHLTTNFNELQQGQASLKRLIEIENETMDPIESKDNIILPEKICNISFQDVCFSYNNDIQVINNLNLDINPGEVAALVGPSGSGKSTIFSMLLRFNLPNRGSILFNEINLSNLKISDIRRKVAIVPQRVNILSGTISEAISFGRNVTEEEVIKASKIANAHEFIMNLKNKYNTFIEERGTNLSGGQLQRISIARAILGNPLVLLLDEATSALDAEAESAVQTGLKQAMKGRTVLIIAHRLSTVQEADKIIFLNKGTIEEIGTHDYLISRGGMYSDLCQKQFIRNSK
ncbi:ABC transporter [Prochlorococcus sp. MIT 0601]|nr:ABC transporter [Prochlorococcus sp. MIT 0601]